MRSLFVALTALLLSLTAQAGSLRLFDLHNRTADEIIPLVQPLIAPDGAVTGSNYQLIVRGSPQQLSEVEKLLRQIDTAAQQLVISVRQGGTMDESGSGYSAQGSIGSSDIRVGVDGPSTPAGGAISTYGSNGSGSVRIYRNQQQRNDNVSQRLMVLEGQWATINAGQQVPIQRQTIVHPPYGTQVQQSTEFADASSGFDVRPRLSGDQVTLEIAPYRRKLSSSSSGAIDTQSITTTVRGRLGEWIEIGGVNESGGGSEGGIGYSTNRLSNQTGSVWLKVEVAN